MDNPENCVDLTDDTSNPPNQDEEEEEGMEFTDDMFEWDVLDETSESDNEDDKKNEENVVEDDSDDVVVIEKAEEKLHSDIDTTDDVPSDSIEEAKPKHDSDNVVDENQCNVLKKECPISEAETGDKNKLVDVSEDDIKDTRELKTGEEASLDVTTATDTNTVLRDVAVPSKYDDQDSTSTLPSMKMTPKTDAKNQDTGALIKDQAVVEMDTSTDEDAGMVEVSAPKSRRQPTRAAASRKGKRMTTRSSSSKISESTGPSDSLEAEEDDATKLPVEEYVPKPVVSPKKAAVGKRETRSKAGKSAEDKNPADDTDDSTGTVVVDDIKSLQPVIVADDKNVKTLVKAVGRKRGGRAAAKPTEITEESDDVNTDITDKQSIEKMETGTTQIDEDKILESGDVQKVMPAPNIEVSENIPLEIDTEKSNLASEENSKQIETALDNLVSPRPTTEKSPTKKSINTVEEDEVIIIESNSEGESGMSGDQPLDSKNKEIIDEDGTAEDEKIKAEVKSPQVKKEPLQEQIELTFGNSPALKRAPVEVKILDLEVSDLTKEEVILAFRHSQSFHIDFPNRPEQPGMAVVTYWLCNVSRQKIICKTLAKLKNRGLNLVYPKLINGMIRSFQKSVSGEKNVPGRGTLFPVKASKFQAKRKMFDIKINPKVRTGVNPIERSMYVDNIPQTTNERKLKELFPTAKRACIPRKPGGSLLGWAVMEFPDKAAMFDAIDNNKDLMINDHKIILSKIKKGNNKIPDTPRMNLWLWGIKSNEAFKGRMPKRQFEKFQNRNQIGPRNNNMFRQNVGLGQNRPGMVGLNMNPNMGSLNMGPNMGNMGGLGMSPNMMGQGMGSNMGGPSMGPNMGGPNMQSNMGGPNMGLNMVGPNMGPNMRGPNMGPNMGSHNMGSNMSGQNMGLNMSGQGMGGNVRGRNMGTNAGIGQNMSGAGMGHNVSGSGPNMGGMEQSRGGPNMSVGQNFAGSGNMQNMAQGLTMQSPPRNTQLSPLSPNLSSRRSHYSDTSGRGGKQRGRERDRSFQRKSRFDSQSSDHGSRYSQERDFGSRDLDVRRSPDFDRRSRFDDDRNRDFAKSRSTEREQMYDREILDYDRNRDSDRGVDYDRDINRGTDFERKQRERDRSRSFDRGSDRNHVSSYGGKSSGAGDGSRNWDRPGRSQYSQRGSIPKRQRKISTEEIVSSPESDLGLDYRGRKDTTVLQKNLSEKLGVVLSNERHGVQDDRAMVVLLQTALNAMQKTSSPSPERSPPRTKPVRKLSPSPRRHTSTTSKRKNPFPQQHEQEKRRLIEDSKFESSSSDAGWRSGGFKKLDGGGGMGHSTSQRGFVRGGRQRGAGGRGAGNRSNSRDNYNAGNKSRGLAGRGAGNRRGRGGSKFQNQSNRMESAQTDGYRPQTSSGSYEAYRPPASTQQQQIGGQQGMSSGYGRQQYSQSTFQASQSYSSFTGNYNQGQGQQRY